MYWTKVRQTIPAGETPIGDGGNPIRARCGNRISETPRLPVREDEPSEEILGVALGEIRSPVVQLGLPETEYFSRFGPKSPPPYSPGPPSPPAPPEPIPEQATAGLVLAGLGVLALWRGNRRRRLVSGDCGVPCLHAVIPSRRPALRNRCQPGNGLLPEVRLVCDNIFAVCYKLYIS